MELVQPLKIQICPIHDIDCTRFWNEMIKDVDVMNLAVRDPYESWDVAPQIQKGVQLYGPFCFSESSPWKDR